MVDFYRYKVIRADSRDHLEVQLNTAEKDFEWVGAVWVAGEHMVVMRAPVIVKRNPKK